MNIKQLAKDGYDIPDEYREFYLIEYEKRDRDEHQRTTTNGE